MSQDTLPSPLPIGFLTKYYYSLEQFRRVWYTSEYDSKYASDYRILQYGSG